MHNLKKCLWASVRLCFSERAKLKRSDFPLVLSVMQGPCEQVCKLFLMEEDLGEEVTYDVNLYTQRPTEPGFFSARSCALFLLHSIRWRNISSLRCPCCRASSPSWRRRKTERCRSWGEGTFTQHWRWYLPFSVTISKKMHMWRYIFPTHCSANRQPDCCYYDNWSKWSLTRATIKRLPIAECVWGKMGSHKGNEIAFYLWRQCFINYCTVCMWLCMDSSPKNKLHTVDNLIEQSSTWQLR